MGLTGGCGTEATRAKAREPGAAPATPSPSGFLMFQLTDTHWGYSGPANPNPTEAFERAVAEIASWPMRPELVVHTGDVTHMTTDAGARKARLEQAKALLGKLGSFLVYADASERPREEATSRGFHVITWTSGVGMALVSDVAWEDLHQLEARLRK